MKGILARFGVTIDSGKTIALVGIIGTAIALAAIAFAIDFDALDRAFNAMLSDPLGLSIALGAFLTAFLLRAFAWKRMVPGLTLGQSLAAIHLALGANHVLPLRLGEPFRVASVVRRQQISIDAAASSTVLLRTADIATVLGIGWLIAPAFFMRVVGGWVFIVAALLAVLAVGGFMWLRKTARVAQSVRFPGPVAFGLTASAWFFEAILVWHSASWAGLEISASDAVLVTTIAVAAQIVAIAPSGLGTYEAASVAAYTALGHDAELALVAALTAHALKTAYSLITGGIATFAPNPGFLGNLRLTKQALDESPSPHTEGSPVDPSRPVVLFMPAHNEEASVGQCLRRTPSEVLGHRVHTVVIDDGSSDRTAEIARAEGAEVISFETNRGLGAGVRFGLEHSLTHEPVAVAFCDADEEYPPEELANLVAPILRGDADYVGGSRFMGTIEHMRPHRRFGNIVLTKMVAFLSRTKVTDGQTGYRAFSPAAAADAEVIHDFNYAQVITLDLLAKGYRYAEVGITYRFRSTGDSFIKLGPYLRRVLPAIYRELNGPAQGPTVPS